jgi:hypothetical protein
MFTVVGVVDDLMIRFCVNAAKKQLDEVWEDSKKRKKIIQAPEVRLVCEPTDHC